MSSRRIVALCLSAFVVLFLSMAARVGASAEPKAIAKCQATLNKAGTKFIGAKLKALGKCTDGVYKCIQTVDETPDAGAKRTACITKARGGCLKSLAAITTARQGFTAAVTKACATLDPAQVTGADGLGFGSTDCSEFSVTVTDVATAAACLAAQHNCRASEMFGLQLPRTLALWQFTPPDAVAVPPADAAALDCLEDDGGAGTDVEDVVQGKALAKCQKAIEKVGAKLAGTRFKTLTKCTDALFVCAATKAGADLVKCRDKARAGCQKAFDKLEQQSAALASGLTSSCGDPALFAALRSPAGSNLDGLLAPLVGRAGLLAQCASVATIDEYETCLLAEIRRLIILLLRILSPRSHDLLGEIGCDFGSCGAVPTPTPTPSGGPNPTVTPTASGGPNPTVTATLVITEIINSSGDGQGNALTHPRGIAVGDGGTAYVTGEDSDNAFKIASNGTRTLLIETTDDVFINGPEGVAADGTTAYVLSGSAGAEAYKVESNGTITLIIDGSGDGTHDLNFPEDIVVDNQHNVYVAGHQSGNIFKITPAGDITQIFDESGDGAGHTLTFIGAIAVDSARNVYVTGEISDNAFKIRGDNGVITQIISATGDGAGHTLNSPFGIAADSLGNVYVSGKSSGNVFKISNDPTPIVQILDTNGGGFGLQGPTTLAVDAANNLYVVGEGSDNVLKRTPAGVVTQIIDADADGNAFLITPVGLAVDSAGTVYVTGADSDNAFKISSGN